MKITGIKKAVGDFNSWQGTARIYFDSSDGTVWTNVYAGMNEWDEYHSKTISQIYSKSTSTIWERDNKITMRELKELCENELRRVKL
ncbi:hypothetical protein AGMMS49975_16580 [Clostridia bacterium]|nr:hypothetical protein AGMMS49975_16580 [Clostridia bacterium]